MVVPEKPQKNWYQKSRLTLACVRAEPLIRCHRLSRDAIGQDRSDGVPEVTTHHVLVEEVDDHVGQAAVAPVAVN